MTVSLLINEAARAGLSLHLDRNRLRWKASTPPSGALLEKLKAAKSQIVAHLQSLHHQDQPSAEPIAVATDGKTRLATACVVCGRICTGTRPDQYRLVDPADQAGPRVHAKCLEEERP